MGERTVHLVCGPTGAGKTLHAVRLAEQTGGVRFSLDEWMATLFWPDAVPGEDYGWALERVGRCLRQMQSVILQLDAPAVVDAGFTTRAERADFAAWVRAAERTPRLHLVDAPAAERWRRIENRNARRGPTYTLHVTRGMFDFMETLWQPPTPDELTDRVARD